ncbi:uncharacterized protein LOC128887701 [Hylaeus anthracinus]|uniref:uncharacterized protein LOC128887701 n=1 Tax=Hylaeus anthracinus TaxID=313031 RepID=UPI0023B9378F|nr:uncharacterized protein LOC128887701 [Hylaeus anthracinus]
MKVDGKGKEEVVEEIWGKIGAKEKVEEVRRIGKVDREGRGRLLVKMEGVEGKRKVMMAKRELKGRPERIEDDRTEEERRARWKIEREAERERREGKRVQIGWGYEQRREGERGMERSVKGGSGEERRIYKVAFWNVAGLKNKEKDFREGIKKWDVVVMCETWVGRREWEGIRSKATKGYVWELQYAVRRGKKGRAMRGMLIGAREGIKMMRVEREEEEEEEGIMARKIWLGEEVWNMIGVYVNKDLQKKLERMREWMEEREKGNEGKNGKVGSRGESGIGPPTSGSMDRGWKRGRWEKMEKEERGESEKGVVDRRQKEGIWGRVCRERRKGKRGRRGVGRIKKGGIPGVRKDGEEV